MAWYRGTLHQGNKGIHCQAKMQATIKCEPFRCIFHHCSALDACHLPVPVTVPVREKVTPIFLFYVTHGETFREKGGEEPGKPEVEVRGYWELTK